MSVVTIFLVPGGVSKISTQSSQPSRREFGTVQDNGATAMGTIILVINPVLIFQPGLVYVKVS